MKRSVFSLAGLAALLLGVGLAQAVTTHLVLNNTYVPPRPDRGWVRVAPAGWKHSTDDAITNTSLIKFQISAIPQGATIQSAKLRYYIQKSEQNTGNDKMYVYFVSNDAWSYLSDEPDVLRGWAAAATMDEYLTGGQPGWKEIDVALWLQQEVNAGDPLFSVKFDHGWTNKVPYERIASPDAWYSPHRPVLDVVFDHPQTINPDLTLSRHDIAFSTMWPVPYDPVTITATVHNVGGQTTPTGFWVRFYDNGQWINNQDVYVNPIPGGGGTGTAQITWYPTEGEHDIEVIADVFNDVPNEINEDNNSNADLSNDGEAYTYEVRPQYKYYAESFETDFGRWNPDADEAWNPNDGREDWEITRNSDPGEAYEGNWCFKIRINAGPYDDGNAWIERPIPITLVDTIVETSYFARLPQSPPPGPWTYQWRIAKPFEPYNPEEEGLDFNDDVQRILCPSYRRFRHLQSIPQPLAQPEYWVGAGLRAEGNNEQSRFYDLFTVRVDPPRSATEEASGFNNGTKLVWDGLSAQHLVYMSGDTIYYTRSEDPAGDAWRQREFVGLGRYPAIALDIDGYPRAVWVDVNGQVLYYSKRSDTGWTPPHGWLFG